MTPAEAAALAGWSAGGALVGSVPAALVVGRLWGVDVARAGTANPGTANMHDLAGMLPAVITFLLDATVGAATVLVPRAVGAPQEAAVACAVGAVAGRAWSPWLHWRGGRAQALILASALVLVPKAAAVMLAVYAVGAASRTLGLAGLVNLAVLPAACLSFYGSGWAVAYGLGVSAVGMARRIQGSPDGAPYSLAQRILYDRERPPNQAPS